MTTNNGGLPRKSDVAVVGGGTAGLALATKLKRLGVGSVIVLERENDAGGIPRHCGHYPFGIREYGRLLKGPDYARRNVEAAVDAGVDIKTEVTVTALHPDGRLSLTTPAGKAELQAERVVLCTGAREASRPQRFIGGDRPLGVLSTGALQSMTYLQGMRPFRRPVIIGSELVSFSAIDTCRHLGIRPVAMIEENDRILARRLVQPYLMMRGVALFTKVKNLRILGRRQVEAIEFIDAAGKQQSIEADGAIISGRFRPEAALLHLSHLEVDPGSGGPMIDQFGQCSDPSYYSAGNLLRPAETSGWCWQEGIETAKWIAEDLSRGQPAVVPSVRVQLVDRAIGFSVPQRLSISDRTGGMQKMQIGLNVPVKGYLEAISGGQSISNTWLNSRPVRRVQIRLAPIVQNCSKSPVELSIQRNK
ncbi:MAG: FAD/NAD(P)-binding oxidoreductase [Halioglobus sp.]|nr:FAD/NAD(P)-binding oxidoreductase [Halioglobus sp.]